MGKISAENNLISCTDSSLGKSMMSIDTDSEEWGRVNLSLKLLKIGTIWHQKKKLVSLIIFSLKKTFPAKD